MENQKLETLLNLALETTNEEREKSDDLNAGYNEQEKTWELIVRYSGSLAEVEDMGIEPEILLGGYAILKVPQHLIDPISRLAKSNILKNQRGCFSPCIRRGRPLACCRFRMRGWGLTAKAFWWQFWIPVLIIFIRISEKVTVGPGFYISGIRLWDRSLTRTLSMPRWKLWTGSRLWRWFLRWTQAVMVRQWQELRQETGGKAADDIAVWLTQVPC